MGPDRSAVVWRELTEGSQGDWRPTTADWRLWTAQVARVDADPDEYRTEGTR